MDRRGIDDGRRRHDFSALTIPLPRAGAGPPAAQRTSWARPVTASESGRRAPQSQSAKLCGNHAWIVKRLPD